MRKKEKPTKRSKTRIRNVHCAEQYSKYKKPGYVMPGYKYVATWVITNPGRKSKRGATAFSIKKWTLKGAIIMAWASSIKCKRIEDSQEAGTIVMTHFKNKMGQEKGDKHVVMTWYAETKRFIRMIEQQQPRKQGETGASQRINLLR